MMLSPGSNSNMFMAFWRLIRLPNLIIIALTQILVRYALIDFYYEESGISFWLNDKDFFLLILTFVLIAAAGYAINDYFDMRIDRINKPGRMVLGKQLHHRVGMLLHFMFNTVALFIGAYLAYRVDMFFLAVIFASSTVFLWFYSAYFKKTFLAGNIIISLLIALVPLTVWLFEINNPQLLLQPALAHKLNNWLIVISLFAFFLTLIREIIKDIEDVPGDMIYKCRTLSVVAGRRYARLVALALIVLVWLVLAAMALAFTLGNRLYFGLYIIIAILFPLVMAFLKLLEAKDYKDFKIPGRWIRVTMITGILSLALLKIC